MLVICDNCFTVKDARLGAYCPGCKATGHWFPLRNEAGLWRGIQIYETSDLPEAMIRNAVGRKVEAIRLLVEANKSGLAGGTA